MAKLPKEETLDNKYMMVARWLHYGIGHKGDLFGQQEAFWDSKIFLTACREEVKNIGH
jgi:hypothetical protein